ncbi:MAG: hypothetical protein JSS09_09890 [Verrucomicrobia bacterium]|nr:hypothetical protein [Verrucomicrobiota bacterium]
MKKTHLYKWNTLKSIAEKGFIVAADLTQEWLLPWWWDNYSKYNNYPVTFIDLGLSKEMKTWCQEKGHYIHLPIPNIFVFEKNSFPLIHIEKWEKDHGSSFWESRNAWFKKPLACLQAPYDLSVWIDLDCEVKGSLSSLFSLPLPSSKITLAQKYHPLAPVNSGVILFKKGAKIIEDWAKEALENNQTYVGDQDILYTFVCQGKIVSEDLPSIYNWSRLNPPNPNALIIHWHGKPGKSFITHQIQKKQIQSEGFSFT